MYSSKNRLRVCKTVPTGKWKLNCVSQLHTSTTLQLQNKLEINNSLHLTRKYAGICLRRNNLFREASTFRKQISSREAVSASFVEQIQGQISEQSQMGAFVFIISLKYIFFRNTLVLKIGELFSYSWIMARLARCNHDRAKIFSGLWIPVPSLTVVLFHFIWRASSTKQCTF